MTVLSAWIRTVGAVEELVFCSDSRVRFGCAWDSCQKVFPLPRGDCAIGFVGDTMFAYPFIHAAINAVSLHRGSSRRVVDLIEAKGVLLNSINAMLGEIRDLAHGQSEFDEPDLRLLFGGYSWKEKRFAIWKFHFNNGEREFQYAEIGAWKGLGTNRRLALLGDPSASPSAVRRAGRTRATPTTSNEDVEAIARKYFFKLLEDRGITNGDGLDMEPFEVIRDMLRTEASPHVGGSTQLVKVYQHLNSQPFGVRWPEKSGRVSVLGRLLPRSEKMHVPILDPDTLTVERGAAALIEHGPSAES